MICCLVIHLTFILLRALITAPIPSAVARWFTCQTGHGVAEHPFMQPGIGKCKGERNAWLHPHSPVLDSWVSSQQRPRPVTGATGLH